MNSTNKSETKWERKIRLNKEKAEYQKRTQAAEMQKTLLDKLRRVVLGK